ncbi:MAG: two-component regulator propeller domain-containing protein [Reichenbachiella sp.]|uniref:ligand-binding sensor domain-containing protein n=1 Tax=Reichenbachiella sp. TaxID=2184521 RepID=UPI0032990C96
MRKPLLTILAQFFVLLFLQAGVRDFTIKQYGVDQDFEGIFIYDIVQDEDGFLWLGADDGLYRFDGKTMLKFNQMDSTIGELVTACTVSTDGHLYLGYYNGGVSIVEHGRYRKLQNAESNPSKVNRLYQDKNQVLWGLTQNTGLIRIENRIAKAVYMDMLNQLISYDLIRHEDRFYIGTNEGLLMLQMDEEENISPIGFVVGSFGKAVNALYEDPHDDEILWVGTDEGLFYIEHGEATTGILNPVKGAEKLRVTSITRDHLKTLWVGTAASGLVEIELKNNHAFRLTRFDRDHGFPSNQISSLYVDRENEIWVGTFGNGLVQLNRAFFHHYELKKSGRIEGINDMYQVNENLYYLATDKGLVRAFNQPYQDSLTFEIMEETKGYIVTRILKKDDAIWLGTTNSGLINYDIETNKFKEVYLDPVDVGLSHLVRYVVEGNDGSLWVSIAGNGVYHLNERGGLIEHFNTRNGFYHNEVFTILPDQAGNIWFGAHSVGLALLTGEGEMKFLTKDNIFPARDINSISQDNQGIIWIATSGSGLYSFDGENFQRYDEQSGLLSNFCNAVEVDNAGQVWVGHRKGLSLIQSEYGLVRRFNHPGELGETEAVLNSVTKDIQGNIWFGNPYGVTKVILPHVQHRIEKRETHIQDIRLFFERVDLLDHSALDKLDNALPNDLTFGHKENHITFDFVSINLKNPDGIYYQYQLIGYDKNWSPITSSNLATFTNLDPGKYTFRIRESDHPKYWGDNYEELTFVIDSPYWKKWWFYLLQISIMASLFLITYFISARVQNLFVIRLMVYVSLFIVFEYIHTELEPYIESIAGETPIFQVGANLALALILLPVELRMAKYLKNRESNRKKKQELAESK